MASPQSTTATDAPKANLEQITFRFCSECSNMLYPKEDEDAHKLMFTCRTCLYTEEATSSCVFRHVLNNAVGETAGVTQDVGSDPTVGDPVSSHCSDAHLVAASASAASAASASVDDNNAPALCLRCGYTLLHCDKCKDPASIAEYNDYVRYDAGYAAEKCLRYIRSANLWGAMDKTNQALLESQFSAFTPKPEESITEYLPFEYASDPDADPPEALGVEPETFDWISTLD